MPVAAARAATVAAADLPSSDHRVAGLLVIAFFPAVFWTALIASIGSLTGTSIDPLVLLTIGTAIVAICGLVGQLLFVRVQQAP